MEKLAIKNRKGQNMVIVVEKAERPVGLAIVMHGLSGNKEELHIVTFAEVFKEKNYTVIRFDTTNTFGESDGNYEDATVTNYYEDLEDVIAWVKTQLWYMMPFCLAGQSLRGICIMLYAEKHPVEIKGLVPMATVVSGQLSLDTFKDKKILDEWKKIGWREEISTTVPGRIKRLSWSHLVDRLEYDILPNINQLTMPVLLIVGDKDESTPPEQQQLLFDKLPGRKEIHIIKNMTHTKINPDHLAQIKQIFINWIEKL